MKIKHLSLSIFLVFCHANGSNVCHSYNSPYLGKTIRYCLEFPEIKINTQSTPVVFFFHGINGNENTWRIEGFSKRYQELTAENKIAPFIVVSFATEINSFFIDHPLYQKRKYATWFEKEFLPFVTEKFNLCDVRKCRGTWGSSMGGYGALHTSLRLNHLFSFAVAHAPALSTQSPFKLDPYWWSYYNRHPIGPWQGEVMLQLVRERFFSNSNYLKFDPLHLIHKLSQSKNRPEIYIDVGGRDYFGFQEGFLKFTTEAEKLGYKIEKVYLPAAPHTIQFLTMDNGFAFTNAQFQSWRNFIR